MEAYEDPKPMKRLSFKHVGRLLTELVVLLAIYLLGTQLVAWLAWPIPGGVMGLGLLLAAFATGSGRNPNSSDRRVHGASNVSSRAGEWPNRSAGAYPCASAHSSKSDFARR